MTSILKTDNISTVAGSGTIRVKPGNDLYASGHVVQVQYTKSFTDLTHSSATWLDVVSVNITPKYANSLVQIRAKLPMFAYGNGNYVGGGVRVLRGSTVIDDSLGDTSGPLDFWVNNSATSGYQDLFQNHLKETIDTPNTTAQLTYKVQIYTRAQNIRINYGPVYGYNPHMLLTATEIAQ